MSQTIIQASLSEWLAAPRTLALEKYQAHIWCADLDCSPTQFAAFADTLSHDERARADQFKLERDHRRFIARRGVLRTILGRYLHCEPIQIKFQPEPLGKPRLAFEHESPLEFNLSHSNGLAVYVVAQPRVGIDVELVRQVEAMEDIAAQFFSAQENWALKILPAEKKTEGFFNSWTRKEAYLKATGGGLSQPTDSFDVTLIPGEPVRLVRVRDNPTEIARWSLTSFAPREGYIASLAIEGKLPHLGTFDFWK